MKANRKPTYSIFAITILLIIISFPVGCGPSPKSARGFRLPDGDPAKGKSAFIAFKCYSCHTVDGAEVPAPTLQGKPPIRLGGEVTRTRTYGDLVTSIINPSHRLSPRMSEEWAQASKISPMANFNDSMTVSQMIDLVAFLQPHYRTFEMDYQYYP